MAESLFDGYAAFPESEGDKHRNQRKENKQYRVSLIISIIALVISAVSLVMQVIQ
jgi:hypothetical protein